MKSNAVKEAQEKLVARKQAKVSDFKRTFGTEHGKRVLLDLILSSNIIGTTYKKDVNEMLVLEGGRNKVLEILAIMETDAEKFLALIREANRHGNAGRN